MWEFCKFEIKYRLKHISTFVFTILLVGFAILLNMAAGGAIGGTVVNMSGTGDKVAVNSPFIIYAFSLVLSFFCIFVMASLINHSFNKDLESKFYHILFTKPVKKYQYIFGRFLGNFFLMTGIFIVTLIALAISVYIPGMEKDMIITSKLSWYLNPLFVMILPNFYFMGALFIASVIITKKTSSVFGMGFLLFISSSVAGLLTSKIDNQAIASLLDPFGQKAFELSLKGWTSAEMNTQAIGLTYYMLLNRVVWILLSTVMLIFAWKKFNFEFSFKSRKKKELIDFTEQSMLDNNLPEFNFICNFQTRFLQFKSAFCFHLKQIIKAPAIYYVTILGLLFMVIAVIQSSMIFGTQTLPVTYHVANVVYGGFMIFMLLIITYFSGELIWSSRENKFNQIEDAMPVSTFSAFFSKFSAMAVLIAVYIFLMMLTGIIYQMFKGYHNYEIGLYLKILFVQHYPRYLMLLFLSFFIHNFVNHKYAAHFIFVIFVLGRGFLSQFGIEHYLLIPFSAPGVTYSDMSGFGPNVTPAFWFTFHWILISFILGGITVMNWKTGVQQNYGKNYLRKLKSKTAIIYNGVFIALTIASTLYIYYNTNIINTFITSKKQEKLQAQYEKTYKRFEKQNQPKIQDIKLNVELYPENREMHSNGSFVLKNIGETSIDTLLVHYYSDIDLNDLALSVSAELVKHDEIMGLKLYKLSDSLSPNDSLIMNFDISYTSKGFKNSGANHEILENGSFLHSHYFPAIGYNRRYEIVNERKRKKYNLPEQSVMPETKDPWGLSVNYISTDANWISFEATVSTSSDQIALSPGELVKSWTENDRNYFTYKLDKNMLNFYTFLSARYEVKKDKWNDIDLEIYYHHAHPYNLDSMMLGLKESLDYYTNAFGPYPHSILRIAEFPRYGYYAQAFPTLIPFSEGIGFIADVQENTIDYPYYVTAHEVGHQWWAHQVIGGWTRGTIMLSESFTEYSSLMVVKQRFGDYLYRKQLRYALDQYLMGRSSETKYELPLTQVENQQYLFYNKGMLVMNATSRLLGEDVLNQALKEFLQQTKYTANPYTDSEEFMKVLDPFVPDSLKILIDDLFNKIVIFEHKIEKVSSETLEDGRFKITLDFTTEKRYYDEKGHPEIKDYSQWIEIGLINDSYSKGKKIKNVYQVDKVFVQQRNNSVEIISDKKPSEIIIDPYFLTLDLIPYNNFEKVK